MIPKRSFILPAVSALAVGAVVWAAHGPAPLATNHQHNTKTLNAKLADDSFGLGDCNGTAGPKGLLTKPTPPTDPGGAGSTSYSIVAGDGSGILCYVVTLDGNIVQDVQNTGTLPKTVTISQSALNSQTVEVLAVDGENGGKYDTYAWGPGITKDQGTKAMVFSPDCKATNGSENLLTNPSGWGSPVTITYNDEWDPNCVVWYVDGQFSPPETGNHQDPGVKNTTGAQLLSHNVPPDAQTVTVYVVDGDHGGDWDSYTWNRPPCYTATGTTWKNVTINNKGEVSGTLLNNGCGEPHHKVIETFFNNNPGPQNNDTDPTGKFHFGGHPPSSFPSTISFHGDATAGPAPDIHCPTYDPHQTGTLNCS